jgi:biotin carboxyl carrier protein
MRYFVTIDPEAVEASASPVAVDVVETPDGRLEARVGGRTTAADLVRIGGETSVRVDGRIFEALVDGALPQVHVRGGGRRWSARVENERSAAADAGTAGRRSAGKRDAAVRSPMPGRVVRVLVAPGDILAAGRGVAILEAMKMENEVRSAHGGVVARVHVVAGATVDANAPLVTLAPDEPAREPGS